MKSNCFTVNSPLHLNMEHILGLMELITIYSKFNLCHRWKNYTVLGLYFIFFIFIFNFYADATKLYRLNTYNDQIWVQFFMFLK